MNDRNMSTIINFGEGFVNCKVGKLYYVKLNPSIFFSARHNSVGYNSFKIINLLNWYSNVVGEIVMLLGCNRASNDYSFTAKVLTAKGTTEIIYDIEAALVEHESTVNNEF